MDLRSITSASIPSSASVSAARKTQVDLPAVGDKRHVPALAGYPGLAERYGAVLALIDLALGAVERAGFQENDRVRVPDGGEHHALYVVRGYGRDDFEAGEVAVEVLQGVGVLGGELDAAAVGSADDERDFYLTAGEVAYLSRRSG